MVSSVGPGLKEFRNLCLKGKLSTCWGSVRESNGGTGAPKLDEDIHIILGGPKWDKLQQKLKIDEALVLRL